MIARARSTAITSARIRMKTSQTRKISTFSLNARAARAFKLNVEIFLVCEVFILILALVIAVLRALAIIYSDLARGVPTVLVIALLGFGAPALQLQGVPTSRVF